MVTVCDVVSISVSGSLHALRRHSVVEALFLSLWLVVGSETRIIVLVLIFDWLHTELVALHFETVLIVLIFQCYV